MKSRRKKMKKGGYPGESWFSGLNEKRKGWMDSWGKPKSAPTAGFGAPPSDAPPAPAGFGTSPPAPAAGLGAPPSAPPQAPLQAPPSAPAAGLGASQTLGGRRRRRGGHVTSDANAAKLASSVGTNKSYKGPNLRTRHVGGRRTRRGGKSLRRRGGKYVPGKRTKAAAKKGWNAITGGKRRRTRRRRSRRRTRSGSGSGLGINKLKNYNYNKDNNKW